MDRVAADEDAEEDEDGGRIPWLGFRIGVYGRGPRAGESRDEGAPEGGLGYSGEVGFLRVPGVE